MTRNIKDIVKDNALLITSATDKISLELSNMVTDYDIIEELTEEIELRCKFIKRNIENLS